MPEITVADFSGWKSAAELCATKCLEFYDKPRRKYGYIAWSVGLRVLTVFLLAVAATAPFSESLHTNLKLPFSNSAQMALAALALAGVLMGVNQVFMVTATWSRYTMASMKIKMLKEVFTMEWVMFLATVESPPTKDDVKRASELCRNLVLGTLQVSEAETSAWAGELGRAVDGLHALIKEQRVAIQDLALKRKQAEDAEEKASAAVKTGAVRIRVDGEVSRLRESPKVKIGNGGEKPWLGGPLMFEGLAAGITTAKLIGKMEETDFVPEQGVVVVPGTIVDVTITVPKA